MRRRAKPDGEAPNGLLDNALLPLTIDEWAHTYLIMTCSDKIVSDRHRQHQPLSFAVFGNERNAAGGGLRGCRRRQDNWFAFQADRAR